MKLKMEKKKSKKIKEVPPVPPISHIKIISSFNLNWFQGEILKHVSNFLYKVGVLNMQLPYCKVYINEALGTVNTAISLKIGEKKKRKVKFAKLVYHDKRYLSDLVEDYREQFVDSEEYITIILIGLIEENYEYVKDQIVKLKEKYYG